MQQSFERHNLWPGAESLDRVDDRNITKQSLRIDGAAQVEWKVANCEVDGVDVSACESDVGFVDVDDQRQHIVVTTLLLLPLPPLACPQLPVARRSILIPPPGLLKMVPIFVDVLDLAEQRTMHELKPWAFIHNLLMGMGTF